MEMRAFAAGTQLTERSSKASPPQTETATAFQIGSLAHHQRTAPNEDRKTSKPIVRLSPAEWSQLRFEMYNELMEIAPVKKFPWQLPRAPTITNHAKHLWMYLHVCSAKKMVLLDYVDNPHCGFFGIMGVTVIDSARFNSGPFPIPSQYTKGPKTFLHKYVVAQLWNAVGLVEADPRPMRYSQKRRRNATSANDTPPPMMNAMAVVHAPPDTPTAVAVPVARDTNVPMATVVATISDDGVVVPVGEMAAHHDKETPNETLPRPVARYPPPMSLAEAHALVCRADAEVQSAFARLRHAHVELARAQMRWGAH